VALPETLGEGSENVQMKTQNRLGGITNKDREQ
jgi:hypothetical protein